MRTTGTISTPLGIMAITTYLTTALKAALSVALIVTFMLVPALSWAVGIGAFYYSGSGDSTIRVDSAADIDGRMELTGYGLLLDTNVGRDHVFNYRLTIGQAEYGNGDSPYEALIVTNDFGFSIARNSKLRLWLGPEIMVTLINDDAAAAAPDLFGFGMGLAAGLNLHIRTDFSIALKAAYVSQTMSGRMTIGGSRYDVVTDDEFSYAGVSLIYRFGERF